jgi:hypothetical protein
MKHVSLLLFGLLLAGGLQLALGGCVAEVDGPGIYGGDHWYHDGPWMDGGRWGGGARAGVGIDIHPPGFRR